MRSHLSHGVIAPNAEGKVIRRGETYQYRRWPNGREDRSHSETVAEFADMPAGRTRLQMAITRHRDQAAWWERWIPPVSERQVQRRQLTEMFARCERDLSA